MVWSLTCLVSCDSQSNMPSRGPSQFHSFDWGSLLNSRIFFSFPSAFGYVFFKVFFYLNWFSKASNKMEKNNHSLQLLYFSSKYIVQYFILMFVAIIPLCMFFHSFISPFFISTNPHISVAIWSIIHPTPSQALFIPLFLILTFNFL